MSDFKILEICGQLNHEEHTQKEAPKLIEAQNIKTQITTNSNSSTSILTQDRTKADHEWKEDYNTIPKESRQEKSQSKAQKVDQLLQNIPMDSITEINELIYKTVQLVSNKIGILLRNS